MEFFEFCLMLLRLILGLQGILLLHRLYILVGALTLRSDLESRLLVFDPKDKGPKGP